MSNVYREAVVVHRKADARRFGLLKSERPATHGCRAPGWLRRLLGGIHVGHLWRCRCGAVWRLCWISNQHYGVEWERAKLDEWTDAGGEP